MRSLDGRNRGEWLSCQTVRWEYHGAYLSKEFFSSWAGRNQRYTRGWRHCALDDNFDSVIQAIEDGRAVFENIRDFIIYIFASNIPELIP